MVKLTVSSTCPRIGTASLLKIAAALALRAFSGDWCAQPCCNKGPRGSGGGYYVYHPPFFNLNYCNTSCQSVEVVSLITIKFNIKVFVVLSSHFSFSSTLQPFHGQIIFQCPIDLNILVILNVISFQWASIIFGSFTILAIAFMTANPYFLHPNVVLSRERHFRWTVGGNSQIYVDILDQLGAKLA